MTADDRLANLLASLATGLADDQSAAVERATGLQGAAATAVLTLHEFAHGDNVGRLAAMLGLSHSGAVRVVSQLEAAGLARRRQRTDRRQVNVELTPKGRRLADRAAAARLGVSRGVVAPLPRAERRELERSLEQVVAALVEQRLRQRARSDEPRAWLCRSCDASACGRDAGRCPAQRAAAAANPLRA